MQTILTRKQQSRSYSQDSSPRRSSLMRNRLLGPDVCRYHQTLAKEYIVVCVGYVVFPSLNVVGK